MTKNVLFVCVENAGRSQMAEAFFRKFAENKFNVISAGTTPSPKLNPVVIEVMKEIGIDMTEQSPKTLSNSKPLFLSDHEFLSPDLLSFL